MHQPAWIKTVRRRSLMLGRAGWALFACQLWPLTRATGAATPDPATAAHAPGRSPVEQFAREWEEKFVLKDYEPADPLARSLHDYFKMLFAALSRAAADEKWDVARVVGEARRNLAADTERMIGAFASAGYKRADAENYFDRLYPRLQVEIARALIREDAGRQKSVAREDASVSDGLILKAEELRYGQKDYVGALKALEDALRFAPSNVRVTLDRALLLQKIGRLDEARASFDLARELYPNVVAIYIGLGDVRTAARDYYGAIEDANTAIYLQPTAMRAYAVRGHAKLGLEDYQGAVDDYGLQVASGDGFAIEMVHFRRALAHFELGNIELALADAEIAIRLNPQYVPGYAMLGRAQRRLGQYSAALATLNRALEMRPRHAPSLSGRAWVRFDLGQEEAALADVDHLIALEPDHAFHRYVRACLLELMGRLDAAERAGREAIDLARAKRDTQAWHYASFQLDLLLRRQGRPDTQYLNDVLDWPDDWAKRVAMHLAGRIPAESLLTASQQASRRAERRIQECEANYYVGMVMLLAGRTDEAARYLRAAADPKYEGNVEQTFAEKRLREIEVAARAVNRAPRAAASLPEDSPSQPVFIHE